MKKQFKTESKKLMDLMINSIYTNKEIFLRELISNASDAIDKLHYKSLTDKEIKVNKKDFKIEINIDSENRTLTISDNGIGMNKEELENNLGVIAKSGSELFKEENKSKKNIDIIGQFGVGFYSAFMVSKKIEVISKSYFDDETNSWVSTGVDGYEIKSANKENYGTDIILTINDGEEFDEFLHEHKIVSLIKKYSNYITYPILVNNETINDMVPLWKRNKTKIKDEEYNTFYSDKFFDYNEPAKVIHYSAEGMVSFNAMLFIPSVTPMDFYSKNYEKGLQLYSNGVLIMEKCESLLPDYFSFVKGVVDSSDISLNISRETLQDDKKLSLIAKNIENKIASALKEMFEDDFDTYEKVFDAFGANIKFGIYDNFGMNKDKLKDLLIFYSSKNKKRITLKEYVDNMKDETSIFYACGETVDKINMLPIVEKFKDKKMCVLYCPDYMDEFALKTINTYEDKKLVNIADEEVDIASEDEKNVLKEKNESSKDMFTFMKDIIKIKDVKYTNNLTNHPVCLSTVGNISIEMEKVINAMPTDETVTAEKVLQINMNHPIADKIEKLYKKDKDELEKLTKILYAQARLIEGLSIENPTELTNLICEELSK